MSVLLFILGLVAFLFGIGFVTMFTMGKLNRRISGNVYSTIERLIIFGMLSGIVAMFQPWLFEGLNAGFLLLFVCTLAYVVWSHVIPASEDVV